MAQPGLQLTVRDSLTQQEILGYNLSINGRAVKAADGRVDLSAFDSPYLLRISHVGYAPHEGSYAKLGERLQVLLRGEQQLEEVQVNTGYQKISRERLTGSVDLIGRELLERSPVSNILNRLEDITPAIAFDRRRFNYNFPNVVDNNLTVRGISTISSEARPLIVLDNFPYDGAIETINPNDVESISVLKDAAASSIWGARAGNGVIVITTKKGRAQDVPRINLVGNVSIGAQPNLFRLRQAGSSAYIDMEMLLFARGFYDAQINNPRAPALSPVVELLRLQREGTLAQDDLQAQLDVLRGIDIRQDYMDYFYRPSVDQRYALNMSGGGERNGYYLSAGYDGQQPFLRENSTQRITMNSAYNHKLGTRLELQGKLMFSRLLDRRSPFGYEQVPIYPYADLVDEQGQALPVNYRFGSRYLDGLEGRGLLDWRYRPYDELRNSNNRSSSNELLLDLGATLRPLPGLSYSLSGQATFNNGTSENMNSLETYFTRSLVNLFTREQGGSLQYGIPLGAILERSNSERQSLALRNQLNYERTLSTQHRLSAMLGMELRQVASSADASRLYGYNPSNLSFLPVDMASLLPTFNNLGGSQRLGNAGFSRTSLTDRFVSYYANVAYNYHDRYDVYGSARRDASNIFGVDTNNKWAPLWSVGAAWNIQQEAFWNSDLLSQLKLRLSYGHSGNVNSRVAALTTIRHTTQLGDFGRMPLATLATPPNPSLRWEKVKTLNLGLDFALLHSRLRGSIDLYRRRSVDLIAITPVDPTVGFRRLTMNSANIEGKGMDLQLNSQNLRGALQWSSNLLLSYSKVMVTRYMGETRPVMSTLQDVAPLEGYPAFGVFSYRWAGLNPETGDPIGFLNGERSEDWRNMINNTPIEELRLHGTAVPLWFGALRNDLRYRHFLLSVNVGFRFAYFFRQRTQNFHNFGSWRPLDASFLQRWQQPGDEKRTHVPSFEYPSNSFRNSFYNGVEANVLPGDVIRLNDIRLTYQLGRWRGLRSVELFGLLSNVGILWRANSEGWDPATPTNELGLPRSASFGLSIGL
ncbi:SusC/RagA family TonB-linked outer membrane protein [Sphingobacterium griseoflavum]|nr:SusC/RagA family TonB-linked outer membrane protein [Sphingobacterium griseoflavum]